MVLGALAIGALAMILPGAARAGEGEQVRWQPACHGGASGEATDGEGRRVTFRVCPLPGGGFDSRVADRAGNEMTGVMASPGMPPVIRIGTVVLADRDYSDAELDAIGRVLDSPDGPLARRLPVLLEETGLPEDSPVVRSLAAHGPLWERGRGHAGQQGMHPQGGGCLSPGTGCLGCCGPGCAGCTGICTPECLAHDECVARLGHLHPRCLQLLQVAIDSVLECLDCNPHCTDGPADCCRGKGPACLEIP